MATATKACAKCGVDISHLVKPTGRERIYCERRDCKRERNREYQENFRERHTTLPPHGELLGPGGAPIRGGLGHPVHPDSGKKIDLRCETEPGSPWRARDEWATKWLAGELVELERGWL